MKLTNKLMTGVATAAIAMTSALPALAAEKWDMPMDRSGPVRRTHPVRSPERKCAVRL